LKIAYFAQHQTEEFDPDKTPYQTAREIMYDAKEKDVYTQRAGFGLEKSKADTQIAKLSGGERSRLLLSMITIHAPHILILDEPTNHLDITSRRALIDALNDFAGAVILVAHDFHMIEAVCDRLILVEHGRARNFDGDIEDYKNYVLRRRGKEDDGPAAAAGNEAGTSAARRKTAAQIRAQSAPLRKKIKELEASLAKLTARKESLEKVLISSFKSDLSIELAFVNKEIADLESAWLEASEAIDEISAES
jgi:ATP-binding cassette subfamily F protein 3